MLIIFLIVCLIVYFIKFEIHLSAVDYYDSFLQCKFTSTTILSNNAIAITYHFFVCRINNVLCHKFADGFIILCCLSRFPPWTAHHTMTYPIYADVLNTSQANITVISVTCHCKSADITNSFYLFGVNLFWKGIYSSTLLLSMSVISLFLSSEM